MFVSQRTILFFIFIVQRSGTEDRDVVDFHTTSKNTNELQKPMSFGKPMELVHENSKFVDGTLRERDRFVDEKRFDFCYDNFFHFLFLFFFNFDFDFEILSISFLDALKKNRKRYRNRIDRRLAETRHFV